MVVDFDGAGNRPWVPALLASVGAVVLFVCLSLPAVYQATARLFPGAYTSPGGPTPLGVLIHALVYLCVYWAYLYLWTYAGATDD